jgi:hypothetical protein
MSVCNWIWDYWVRNEWPNIFIQITISKIKSKDKNATCMYIVCKSHVHCMYIPGLRVTGIFAYTCTPTRVNNFRQHCHILWNFIYQIPQWRYDRTVSSNHIFGKLLRIAAERIEFKIRFYDEISEGGMCGQSYTMTIFLQSLTKLSKWLDITTKSQRQK